MKALIVKEPDTSMRLASWYSCYDAEDAAPRFLFQMWDLEAAKQALQHRGYTLIEHRETL